MLDLRDAERLKSLRPFLDIEFDTVPLVEGLIAFANDRLVVDEHIFTGFTLNETEALGSVEPFDDSLFHREISLQMFLVCVRQRRPGGAPGFLPLKSAQVG